MTEDEVFKIIPSFPDYLISNCGRCKTRARSLRYIHAVTGEEHFRVTQERFLKVQFNSRTGYKFHQLYRDKKMYNKPIHSLVADAFLEKLPIHDCVNHKDGNKHNNVVDNLEWCTQKYNHEHAVKTGLIANGSRVATSKLNESCVRAIKYFLGKGFSHAELSMAFGISRSTISLIAECKTWKQFDHSLTGKELTYTPLTEKA